MKFLSRFKRKAKDEPPLVPTASSAYTPEMKKLSPPLGGVSKKPHSPDELILELGDFLHRIPPAVLAPGPHDLRTELRFEISELSRQINRGQTTILLSELYKRCPHIFRGELGEAGATEIRFPWQKLAKLVSLARPADGSVPGDSTVESLAQKLKASRLKNPPPTAAAPASAATEPAESSKPSMPVLPGRGGHKASWFSRPTTDKPVETTTNRAPAARETVLKMPPAPAIPEVVPAPVEPTGGAGPVPPAPPPNTAPQSSETPAPEAAPKPAEDVRIADLPPDLQRKFAVLKGDYERQIAELERRCRATTEARDRLATDLEKIRREYEKAQGAVEAEAEVTAMSREEIQKMTSEKEALRTELTTLKGQLLTLQDESKMTSLIAERDALLQQKGYLASQNAELMKKGGGGQGAANGGGGLHMQRQVEDYQRRIAAMEATQRESALQVAREKEARAKAEKMLAAADKLQEESANYMESAKAEMRKEIEAAARVRENEFRKAQKELQDQITALGNDRSKAATDLENARNQIAELQAKLTSAVAAPAAPDPMQAHLVTQLESDIDSYRERLKILLRERDEARAQTVSGEVEVMQAQLKEKDAALASVRQELVSAHERAKEDRVQLEKRAGSLLSAVEGARQSFTEKRAGLEPALADARVKLEAAQEESKSLRIQLEDLRKQFQREHESLDSERKNSAQNLREQSVALEQQLAVLVRERDELRSRAEALAAELKTKVTAQEEFISTLEKDHTKVVRENDELVHRLADVEAKLSGAEKSMTSDATSLVDELKAAKSNAAAAEKSLAEMKQRVGELEAQLGSMERVRGEAAQAIQSATEREAALREELASAAKVHQDLESARTEIHHARQEHRDLAAVHEGELAAAIAARTELEKKLTTAETTRAELAQAFDGSEREANDLRKEVEQLQAKLAAAQTEAGKLQETHRAAAAELEAARAELHTNLERTRGEFAGSKTTWEQKLQASEKARQEVTQALAKSDLTAASLRQEVEQARAATDEATKHAGSSTAALRRELEEARKASSEATAAARKEAAAVAEELSQRDAAKADLQRELAAAKADLQQARHAQAELTADIDKMRAAASMTRGDWEQKLQATAAEGRLAAARLDEERTARSSASAELADLRRELAAARLEGDNLSHQRDDLLRRLSRITDEHRNLLDELSTPVPGAERPVRPMPTPTVIEVEPEVFTQEPEKTVNLPRIRPVPLPPPKVSNM